MVGEYVMRQSDLQTGRTKPDSIGMGSYNSDSHNAERVAMPDGTYKTKETFRSRLSLMRFHTAPSRRKHRKCRICWCLFVFHPRTLPSHRFAWSRNT